MGARSVFTAIFRLPATIFHVRAFPPASCKADCGGWRRFRERGRRDFPSVSNLLSPIFQTKHQPFHRKRSGGVRKSAQEARFSSTPTLHYSNAPLRLILIAVSSLDPVSH